MYDEVLLNIYFVIYNASKLQRIKEEKKSHESSFKKFDMKKSPSIAA